MPFVKLSMVQLNFLYGMSMIVVIAQKSRVDVNTRNVLWRYYKRDPDNHVYVNSYRDAAKNCRKTITSMS